MVKYTIGLLLIPMIQERQKTMHFVENLKDIMDLYTIEKDVDTISQFYNYDKDVWIHQQEYDIVDHLVKSPFFSRFTRSQLKYILPFMKLKRFETDDVLFTENVKVYILMHGDVVLKSFKYSAFPNKLLALYKKGAVIGSKYESESTGFDNWSISRTHTVVAMFEYDMFTKIWNLQNTNSKLKFLPYVQ